MDEGVPHIGVHIKTGLCDEPMNLLPEGEGAALGRELEDGDEGELVQGEGFGH